MTVNSKVRAAKARSEETSPEVASIAGRILKGLEGMPADRNVWFRWWGVLCTVGELRSLAASALTQTANRKAKP